MIKKQTNKNTKCSFSPDTVPDPFFWEKKVQLEIYDLESGGNCIFVNIKMQHKNL